MKQLPLIFELLFIATDCVLHCNTNVGNRMPAGIISDGVTVTLLKYSDVSQYILQFGVFLHFFYLYFR